MSARLYRTSWLVAGVALIVALLTLQTPAPPPRSTLPPTFDGDAAATIAGELAGTFPERVAGSPADLLSAAWVRSRLSLIPGAGDGVRVQDFEVRRDGRIVRLRNVYLVLPASAPGPARRRGILVVAPRDTPPGIRGGQTGTAVLLELARLSASLQTRERPVLLVSTDASTLGNAGIRWFLSRFRSFPLAGALVLDAPGEGTGDRVEIWSAGRDDRRALELARAAAQAVDRAGGQARAAPGLLDQLIAFAVPQTFGDQGPLVGAGVPAVTLSARTESPLRAGDAPTPERMELVGNAAQAIVGSIDAAASVPPPDGAIALAGRTLRPAIARVALILLALPVLVLAVDGFARLRRARGRVLDGLRALGLRAVAPLVVLLVAHLLVLAGMLPPSAAGVPPLPGDVGLDAPAAAGLLLALAAGALVWLVYTRPRTARIAATAPAEAGVALVVLSALIVLLWMRSPFALVLALPAAHAALVATAAGRPWQVVALVGVGLLPLLALALAIGSTIDASGAEAVWYLLATSINGARGGAGPVLTVLFCVCLWSLGGLVAYRARKGLVAPAIPAAERARVRERQRARRESRRAGRSRSQRPPPARPKPVDDWLEPDEE